MRPLARLPGISIEALSPRRREILALLAQGLTNAAIAKALSISQGTVRSHVTAVLGQLEVTNRTEAAAAFVGWQSGPARVAEVLRRPALAVLPVVALDDDPRTRVVASGLTSDLASLFARFCWFPVIAHSSMANARSLGDTGREIGAHLGARFVLDASLRLASRCGEKETSADTVRLTVRIDDAESGHVLWTEQYTFPAEGLFEVQDAICQTVVAAAYPVLVALAKVTNPSRSRPTEDLAAWELAHEGMAFYDSRDQAGNAAAQERFRAAIARDPRLTLAHFGLGLCSYDSVLNQWRLDGESNETACERLASAAERCLELAPHAAEGYYLLGRCSQARGEPALAIPALVSAISRNPSFAPAHALLAQCLQLQGRSEEALVRMRHAVRLGPRSFLAGLAALHFIRSEYALALEAAERAISSNPRYTFARVVATASAWWLGDAAAASVQRRALQALSPAFESAAFLATFGEKVDAVERLFRALEATATP